MLKCGRFNLFSMKLLIRFLVLGLFATIFISPSVYADRTERAKVIKFDKDYYDTIVQRADGSRWLIQHHRLCQSQSTEFPVDLILDEGKIIRMKVAPNEICTVYKAVPYTGDIRLRSLRKSDNLLVPDYEAEMTWNGKNYLINYGSGCRYLKDFVDKRLYLNLPTGNLIHGRIMQPGNRGNCPITFAKVIGDVQEDPLAAPPSLDGLDYQAQGNQVYFYWNHPEMRTERLLYLISYSKYRIETDDYQWYEMPNLRRTRRNSYTVKRLANGQPYYFYLAAVGLSQNRKASEWIEVQATPISPGGFQNNPDRPEFEISLEETENSFILSWPTDESARRYYVRLYVNGRRSLFKIHKQDENQIVIPKSEEYLNKRLRLSVRTVPKLATGRHLFDGHFWTYKSDE